MAPGVSWTIDVAAPCARAVLSGQIDEEAQLQPLAKELESFTQIRLDTAGIARVNSIGVREWVLFVRALPSAAQVTLERCSPALVAQLNMIDNFAGPARITSVMTPFVCDACGHEITVLTAIEPGVKPSVSPPPCQVCGQPMFLDDFGGFYFAFADG